MLFVNICLLSVYLPIPHCNQSIHPPTHTPPLYHSSPSLSVCWFVCLSLRLSLTMKSIFSWHACTSSSNTSLKKVFYYSIKFIILFVILWMKHIFTIKQTIHFNGFHNQKYSCSFCIHQFQKQPYPIIQFNHHIIRKLIHYIAMEYTIHPSPSKYAEVEVK